MKAKSDYQISYEWYKWKGLSNRKAREMLKETYQKTDAIMLALEAGISIMVYTGDYIRKKA